MALKQKVMYKTVRGNTNLELKADPGESFLIKDVYIYNPATNYASFFIQNTTVGYWRVGGVLGSHLPFVFGRTQHSHDIYLDEAGAVVGEHNAVINAGGVNTNVLMATATAITSDTLYKRLVRNDILRNIGQKTILGLLAEKGLFNGYPVASGEKFWIKDVAQAGAIQVVKYEVYDEGDMKADMPNGSGAKEYIYMAYGNCGTDINKTGDSVYNTCKTIPEFPKFPYEETVPANRELSLYGIFASDFAPRENDGVNYILTNYLKLVRERTTYFDEDDKGLLLESLLSTAEGNVDAIGEGVSVIGNYSSVDLRPPFWFDAPLTFGAGEDVDIYLTTTKGGTGQIIETDEHEIGLLFKFKKL